MLVISIMSVTLVIVRADVINANDNDNTEII